MKYLMKRFLKDDSGATAIEYGLIAGIVSVAIITAFALFSEPLQATFTKIGSSMSGTAEVK